ncbi:hypothetical protein NEHOM01_2423 [Nematocida homosporus]|uniref:uncharacterized protein n=1 Tax=Nematocida homosporus TaxID=1912981 RepID=UPI00221E6FA7|nr:uncharacterized protein NEHOM01_2423 [Nematocida homosporus]KAI5187879.1 hypothetical protein NEHOM01_2423 [Nematocida homosporus]
MKHSRKPKHLFLMDQTELDILNEYTHKRLAELQKSCTLKEITDERLLLKKSKTDTLLVHFYDKRFPRCKEMTEALEILAPKYPSIEFIIAEATKFPFITEKLEVQELPYLASFTKGFFIGGIVGFQDIGEERLDLKLLDQYIQQSDLLEKEPTQKTNSFTNSR